VVTHYLSAKNLQPLIYGIFSAREKQEYKEDFPFNNQKHQYLKHTIMKKRSNSFYTQLTKVQFENLTNIVEETLAAGFNHTKTKVFTAADLWNIQRHGKNRMQKRINAW
jgi:hypothetical protein